MIEDILNRLDEIECSYCKHVGVKFDGEYNCPARLEEHYDERKFDFDSVDASDIGVDNLDDIFDDIDSEDIDNGSIFDEDGLSSDMMELGLEESDFDFNLEDTDFFK